MRASLTTCTQRSVVVGLLVALLLGVVGLVPARAAGTFEPVVTVSTSNDAARAATPFSLKITQDDGEDQIGPIQLDLARDPGFTVDTDVPGSNGTQVGTLQIVVFTDPRPSTLTLDGRLLDDNDRAGCDAGVRQCIIAEIQDVPGYGPVSAQLEIEESVPGVYRIAGDLTDTWANPAVQQIHAGLKELSATLNATSGSHVIVRNPQTAGTWDFDYRLESLTGAVREATLPLTSVEYPPTVPAQILPAYDSVHLSTQPIDFVWLPSTDRNDDTITYTLEVDGQAPIEVPAPDTHALVTLSPGTYEWLVTATADGDTASSGRGRVIVIDPNAPTSYTFTSIPNGDKLYVDPVQHVFVYRQANGALSGARSSGANVDRGLITNTSGFTLVMTYDNTLRAATGAFIQGGARREFVDPAGA